MKLIKPALFITLVLAFGFVLVLALEASGPKGPTIVEVLEELNAPGGAYAGEFDVLLAALNVADPIVLDTLSGNGQHTLFAPNDGAWASLPPGFASLAAAIEELSKTSDSNAEVITPESLTEILLYHVVNGNRNYQSLSRARQVRTLQGEFLYLTDGTLIDALGNPANFVANDIEASNGMIHIIDAVVLPFPP